MKDAGNKTGQYDLLGTFALQLAKNFGAEVTGVCSTTNLKMVRSLVPLHFTAAGELGHYTVLFRILIFGIVCEIFVYQFLKRRKK